MIALRADALRVNTLVAQLEDDDADHWSRVRMVAAAIPPDCDLDDRADVVRGLFAARMCVADFGDVIDDAIEIARERRA